MGEATKIQWCDHTFNPWRGCAKVSAGCANCYAEAESRRFSKIRGVWGPKGTRVVAAESTWHDPFKWCGHAAKLDIHQTVFTASLADWLEDWPGHVRDSNETPMFVGPNGAWRKSGCFPAKERALWEPMRLVHLRDRLLHQIALTPRLTYLLLTKRPEGWKERMREVVALGTRGMSRGGDTVAFAWLGGSPPENARVGASVENQETTSRIDDLLTIPGPNFLSVEPLLEAIDFSRWVHPYEIENPGSNRGSYLDWLIVGGESGHRARPCDLDWIRSIRDQCFAANLPVFVKQLGANPVAEWTWEDFYSQGHSAQVKSRPKGIHDPKGGDPDEWPDDLLVREFPLALFA